MKRVIQCVKVIWKQKVIQDAKGLTVKCHTGVIGHTDVKVIRCKRSYKVLKGHTGVKGHTRSNRSNSVNSYRFKRTYKGLKIIQGCNVRKQIKLVKNK